jgi:hypothetical protein
MLRRLLGPISGPITAIGILGACTLTHPLDQYGDGLEAPADASSAAADGPPLDARDATLPADGGDGCSGGPDIVVPVSGATVGSTFRLMVSAPECVQRMILYVDGADSTHFVGHGVDQSIPITIGTHRINVNGWAGTDQAHASAHVTITRTK